MAATRIDCDIHPAVGGTRTTLLTLHGHRAVTSEMLDGTSEYQLQFTGLF